MIRRPPRSTLDRSSAASDVYKRQDLSRAKMSWTDLRNTVVNELTQIDPKWRLVWEIAVSYTHLRAHETVLDLVCRLLLEKKTNKHK